MADYYTKTTLREVVLLSDDLNDALSARGATTYPEGEGETILDGIVAERPPLSKFSVVFEDGLTSVYSDNPEEMMEQCGLDPEDTDANDEFKRFLVMEEEYLLREILKINPDTNSLELSSSHSCSKMRLDGFGGSSLHVTRKGWLAVSTGYVDIDDDGTINYRGEFHPWKDEDSA